MIPKIIHFCWFGKGEKPAIVLRCIESWKKFCPNYQIIEWNENNFDVNSQQFTKEAYKSKKWAFVTDFVRLYVLYRYGGVYLDADCELLKNIDCFLIGHSVVTGYQEDATIPAAIIFSEKNNNWIKLQMDYYKNRHFVLPNGKFDLRTNSFIITALSIRSVGFKIGDHQIGYGDVLLCDSIVFSPYLLSGGAKNKEKRFAVDKNKTYSIHHGTGSWADKTALFRFKAAIFGCVKFLLSERIYRKIKASILKRKLENFDIN